MTIRYITSGNEPRAKGLLGEGRHQLSILKNAMSFQKLKQLQRVVRFSDGTIIKCSSCFGQDTVNVFVPPYMPVVEKAPVIVKEYEGWEEDWGETVCENHDWQITDITGSTEWCPDPLPSEFTLEDSIMQCSFTAIHWGDLSELTWIANQPEELRAESEIDTAQFMALKINTELIAVSIYSVIALTLQDESGMRVQLNFEEGTGYVRHVRSIEGVLDYDEYYLGNNEDEEQIINLTDYGLDGYINWINFFIIAYDVGDFGQYQLDYIKFSNDLEYFTGG